MELAYLVLAAALCLAGGLFFQMRARNRGGLHPVVRRLLEQAVAQRSVMLVEFTDQEPAAGAFVGSCVEFDEQSVLVDVSLRQERSEWIGERVRASFQIDNKGASSHYQFTSRLRGMPRGVGGFGMLLDLPTEIVSNQKRSFVRLVPVQEVTFGVGIWPLKAAQPRPDDPASLGAARISYRRDHAEQLSLQNVSAAGLCLKLERSRARRLSMDLRAGDRLLCLLMLRAEGGEQTLPLWLDCTVVNRDDREDEPHIVVGLNFNAWAAPHRGKGLVEWFAVDEEGAVGPLGAWVLRQQLAQQTLKKTG